MKIMNYKQMYEKGKAEEQKRILEIIEELFPICTCIDGKNGKELNINCKNELMDGAWSAGLNDNLKAKIKKEMK